MFYLRGDFDAPVGTIERRQPYRVVQTCEGRRAGSAWHDADAR